LGAGIEDFINDLKSTKEQVQQNIQGSLGYGSFSAPSACKLIPVSKRAAVVRAVGEFAKKYAQSDAFKQWYAEHREQHKPNQPEQLKTMAESRKQQVADMKKALAEQEKAYKEAPANLKDAYKQAIEMTKNMLKEAEHPNKEQDAQMDTYTAQANEQSKKDYQEKLAQWEKEYPANNPRPLIKRRLQEFLSATENIDFNAKLVDRDSRKVFANPEYEQKDGNWKLCFRAGKEATEAARAFAQSWLNE
jgi:flagellar biosynthesis GTPase FlhF